MVFNRAI